GTNIWAAARMIREMQARGERGSVVTLLCDSGERYRSTLMNDDWCGERRLDLAADMAAITAFFESGAVVA
ncbi:MAG: PLP-dependent cysteine synthase family protein, partial [Beijerinckiaceae bacterium]